MRDDEADPWSTDQPVAPPPTEFVFDEPELSLPGAPPELLAAPPAGTAPISVDSSVRRRWIGAGVGCAVVVVGLAAATVLGADDDPDDAVAPPTSVTEELPDTNTTSIPATTVPTRPSNGRVTTSGSLLPAAPLAWTDGQMAIPDGIAALDDPTQLVVVTGRGRLIEIDLRDGATSTLDLDERLPDTRLHLSGGVALLGGNGSGRQPILLQRDEQPIEVEIGAGSGGYYVYDNGSNADGFVVSTFDAVSGESTIRTIGTDGSVSDVDESEAGSGGSYAVATGERLVFVSGDVFLVSPPGQQPATSRRFTTGQVIGRSPVALFVSECDDERNCDDVLIDIETETRTPVPDFDGVQFLRGLQLSSMSPDGTAMLVQTARNGTLLLELLTGDIVQFPFRLGSNSGQARFAWALDGSGVFALHGGDLLFVDRLGGQSTELPIELDDADHIVDLDVRRVPGT